MSWTTISPVNEMSEDVLEILLGHVCLQMLPEKQFQTPLY